MSNQMWIANNRIKYDRDKLRHLSDLKDPELALVEPLIPPTKRGGRDRKVDVREVVNQIMYVLSMECQWRYIPKYLPSTSILFDQLVHWSCDGKLPAIHHAPCLLYRELTPRESSPTANVIDSRGVKSIVKEDRSTDPDGNDASKKTEGKKRYILISTVGLALHALEHLTHVRGRLSGILLISTLFRVLSFLRRLFANEGYQDPQFEQAIGGVFPQLNVEIVKRSDAAGGFKVLPRRWSSRRSPRSIAVAACARISSISPGPHWLSTALGRSALC